MTMRRLLIASLMLTGLSILSWVRADSADPQPCCDPIVVADPEECSGGTHDEAMQRYRCNQSRHWRTMLIGGK